MLIVIRYSRSIEMEIRFDIFHTSISYQLIEARAKVYQASTLKYAVLYTAVAAYYL